MLINAKRFLFPVLLTFVINFPCPLLEKFPVLQGTLKYISLCTLPTPIHEISSLANHIGHSQLFIKRDDLIGKQDDNLYLYGGNKPRKLEWLLQDALDKQADTIITYGCAGSNHAVATAVYAQKLGLKTILLLKPQPNSTIVRQNLLLDYAHNAEILMFLNNESRNEALSKLCAKIPGAYFIPTGGSTPLGALGFVNAAYELYEQISNKIMPEPDIIYLPVGSCGSLAGLLLGLMLCNGKAKIIGGTVEPEEHTFEFEAKIKNLFFKTNELLHDKDDSIPLFDFPYDKVAINKNFCGSSYGVWTKKGLAAIQLFEKLEHIHLEGTYTAKMAAALIHDALHGTLNNKTVLIWNTFCGHDFSAITNRYSYKQLPKEVHHYFEIENDFSAE